jgi:hypothetical protein
MDQSFELEISFYCDCAICNGRYHDFSNSYESNAANLEIVENKEDNLDEMERKRAGRKRRLDMAEKEDRKKRHRKDGYLYRDSSRSSRNSREDSYERARTYRAPEFFRRS